MEIVIPNLLPTNVNICETTKGMKTVVHSKFTWQMVNVASSSSMALPLKHLKREARLPSPRGTTVDLDGAGNNAFMGN